MIVKSLCKKINMCNSRKYGQLKKVGDEIFVKRLITTDDVKFFTDLTQDTNTLHEDPVKGIVPGAFLNALVSGVIGSNLFGDGAVVAEQHLKFLKPCSVNTEVITYVSIRSIRKIVEVDFAVFKKNDNLEKITFLEGYAKLFAPGKYSLK